MVIHLNLINTALNKEKYMFTATSEKLFYTIAELSNLLGLTEASIRSRIYRKQLPKVKLGGRILIPTTFIEKLIKQATEPENPF